MKKSEETKFKEMVKKDCKAMRNEYAAEWSKLCLYLDKELSEGKTEFRIAHQGNDHFIIRPVDKDGETIDIHIKC